MTEKKLAIVFDGPPSHESGRFVEVELDGASVSFGEWQENGEFWELVLPEPYARLAEYENDETATRRELALVKRKLEEPTRCNSGHETLPLKLWTCPTCHEELERKLEAIEPKAKMLDMMTEPEHIDSFLEATTGIEEHPDGYDEACMCQLCCSYAD